MMRVLIATTTRCYRRRIGRLERISRRPATSNRSIGRHREDARNAALPEQYESSNTARERPAIASAFSGEVCDVLGATVRSYLTGSSVHEELARVTGQLCREAHARGLSADQTLAEIRATLDGVLASCPLTTSDKAALVALAIDECVHAFYHEHR